MMDDERVASVSWDGTVRIWNWKTGEQQMKLVAKIGKVNALTISRDGQWLVAGGEQGIFVWKESSRERNYLLVSRDIRSLSFHPNSQVLAAGDKDGQIWLLKIGHRDWELIAKWQGHQGSVTALAFHPDGAILFSRSEDTTLAVWDTVSQSLVKRLEGWHQREIRAVAFSPDGKFAVSCSMDDRLRVWRVKDWQLLLTKEGGRNWALALAFAPLGNFIASASKDEKVKVWRVRF